MVGRDINRGVRGHAGHEACEGTVNQLKLVTPLPGLAAMDMSNLVEFSPVEIDKGTFAAPNCCQSAVHPAIKRTCRLETPSAQRRVGQPRAVEEARADPDDR